MFGFAGKCSDNVLTGPPFPYVKISVALQRSRVNGFNVARTCVFSIFVRVDLIGLFRPALFLHPRMIHPTRS
jgi:hypothetical protein